MSNVTHIAELTGDQGISLPSFVSQLTTEDIMKDICINKNWVEGGSLGGHDSSVPTEYWNIYETDSVRVTQTRIDSRHLGGDQVITYEVEKVIARITGECYDDLMSVHWLMGGFGVNHSTTRNAALFAFERARGEGIHPSKPYAPKSWKYRESRKGGNRFDVIVHDDKDAKVLTVTGVIGG